jgi:hypothetical protein
MMFHIQRDNGKYLWGWYGCIPVWTGDSLEAKRFPSIESTHGAEVFLEEKLKIYVWVVPGQLLTRMA